MTPTSHEPGTAAPSAAVDLCTQALSLLVQQVAGARVQMDNAVLDLSSRFAALYGGLDSAVRASSAASSANDAEGGMNEVFDASKAELQRVVDSLREAFRKRDSAVQQVQVVTKHASALQGMVERVAQLAAKTDLLALNATIEASRAGEHGRGFSIVAEEVRKLSGQSRLTSREMTERVGAITTEIRSMASSATQSGIEEKHTFIETEDALQRVLARLQGLATAQNASADILRREGEQMQKEIAQVMVALQFGDRVSQILVHACSSLDALGAEFAAAAANPGAAAASEDFMRSIANGYTTDEQRRNHAGMEAETGDSGGEITFF
jgi:methyl-accepting chemotaxis protein